MYFFLECPGSADTPCNNNGLCSDGMGGNGTCSCKVSIITPHPHKYVNHLQLLGDTTVDHGLQYSFGIVSWWTVYLKLQFTG